MQNFVIGSGFSTAAVVHILDKWLQSGGIHPNARIDNRPVAQVLHQRLTRRFGAQRFRLFRGNLDVMEQGQWRVLVHRDDIYTFLYGKEMKVKVGSAPDPSEDGIKVKVGVMEATVKPGADGKLGTKDDVVEITPTTKIDGVVEWDKKKVGDKWAFFCCACGVTRASKASIEKHIERDH